jgi:site-specific DNA recombinase
MTTSTRFRCAIYTRKSSEEGLEQDFNSLHAQREACEAYIKSQTSEGWRLAKRHYDDGGISGGTLERPALKALLADIQAGRIDVVVVYKIDRLSRALTDFAKLAELFDAHQVSFVSVTQQFNTTTSMGRLMLNVLLSFAQFEREITGERIRDKIAASKQKGIWMGGFVPLGYEAIERKLVVNHEEAKTVRALYALYLKLRNVTSVWSEAARLGLKTKRRRWADGRETGGLALQRGHIYKILGNPLYAGWIPHHGERHEGQHEALVERATWNAVQQQLTANTRRQNTCNTVTSPGLLVGLVFDHEGRRLTHSHARKRNRRYRYYEVKQTAYTDATIALRIPAEQIEARVKEALAGMLESPTDWVAKATATPLPVAALKQCLQASRQLLTKWQNWNPETWKDQLQKYLQRVIVESDALCLVINTQYLASELGLSGSVTGTFVHRVPCRFINRGGQLKLIVRPDDESTGGIDESLIRSVARAHAWFERLKTGEVRSVRDIAEQEKLTTSYVMRYLRLAFLAPDIVEAIVEGRQPPGISVRKLTNDKRLPSDWVEQRRLLNFPAA